VAQPFPVNTKRLDPYKNFKFRLKWDGQYVYGGSKVTGLKRSTEVVEHRSGGDPSTSHKSPGRTKYEAITLERGLTQDMAFHDWAGKVWNFGAGLGSEVSLADFRKDVYLEFYNEAGQLVIAYKIYRCWVSEYQALPDLDANANAIAIEHLKLENEGFERDTSVTEPKEPTLSTVATSARPRPAGIELRGPSCGRKCRGMAARSAQPRAADAARRVVRLIARGVGCMPPMRREIRIRAQCGGFDGAATR
jgi:phage tail-like protein